MNRPTIVMWWLIATASTGMSMSTLATMDVVIIQVGSGPPTKWCIPFKE